jgi:hypothetical protein
MKSTAPVKRRAIVCTLTAGTAAAATTVDQYGHLIPEANGRARDALDRAFASVRVCPGSAPATR